MARQELALRRPHPGLHSFHRELYRAHRKAQSPASFGSRKKASASENEQVWAQVEHHVHGLSFSVLPQTLQMGVKHFSGLFVLLCAGLGLSILTAIGEHIVYRLLLPRIRNKSRLQYWLHTSQVSAAGALLQCSFAYLFIFCSNVLKRQDSQ